MNRRVMDEDVEGCTEDTGPMRASNEEDEPLAFAATGALNTGVELSAGSAGGSGTAALAGVIVNTAGTGRTRASLTLGTGRVRRRNSATRILCPSLFIHLSSSGTLPPFERLTQTREAGLAQQPPVDIIICIRIRVGEPEVVLVCKVVVPVPTALCLCIGFMCTRVSMTSYRSQRLKEPAPLRTNMTTMALAVAMVPDRQVDIVELDLGLDDVASKRLHPQNHTNACNPLREQA